MIRLGLCLLLFAAPVFAGGITSFECEPRRDDRPTFDTPVWYDLTYSFGSRYERSWDLVGAPDQFGAFALGLTWPMPRRLQGWSELAWLLRNVHEEGGDEDRLEMFAMRGGIEVPFGPRDQPWGAAGAGLGAGLEWGRRNPLSASEALGRLSYLAYPTRHTRVGLIASAGPAWISERPGYVIMPTQGPTPGGGTGIRTRMHYEVGLRVESRLRFPRANAD
jgi:hypothetical protein